MKNSLGQDVYYLECECTQPSHMIRVVYEPGQAKFDEDPTLYIDVQLATIPWYRRCWVALKYLFNRHEESYSGWTEHLLTEEGVETLNKAIIKYRLVLALRKAIRAKKARKALHG